MTTPVEASFLWKGWNTTKAGFSYVFALWKRVSTLESRVTALEQELKTAPPDACPYCGERAMRLKEQLGVMGDPGKQWTEEIWLCGKCGKKYTERQPLKTR